MSREAAAQPSAAPPPSPFRSMFARCAGEEQEQQATDVADALSIGPQPALLHGTRRPLAAGQLGHFRKVLLQSARPPFPSRHASPALSRTCRPLSLASRAPHTRSPLTCAPDVSRSADQRAVESGHRRADQQADAGLGSGGKCRLLCSAVLVWPQVPNCLGVSQHHLIPVPSMGWYWPSLDAPWGGSCLNGLYISCQISCL